MVLYLLVDGVAEAQQRQAADPTAWRRAGALDEAELHALLLGYQAGDTAAAEELVRRLSPTLERFLRGPEATRRDSLDLLQQCWLEMHRSRHTFRPDAPVLPWIFAIARHVRRDAWRRLSRSGHRELALGEVPEEALPASLPAAGQDLLRLVERLPPAQGQVVLLLKRDGLTLAEAAAATCSTVGAVKQRAHRAYEALRRMLRDGAPHEAVDEL